MTSTRSVDIREHRLRWEESAPDIPYGYCQCGCGHKTTIAKYTSRRNRRVKGEPSAFRPGHNIRKYAAEQWPLAEYLVEDRGYKTKCWIWQRGKYGSGYGKKYIGDRKYTGAHRWYFECHYGPIPDGLQPDHLCRVRACVNPNHMEAVTCAENTRRGKSTKLVPWKVRAIRRAREKGELSLSHLAKKFGVSRRNIVAIANNKTWKDI